MQNPGDYFCAQIADQSVFVIRDGNDELHAFYNVCSHRAHPLLSGAGNTPLIVCPHHQWYYQTDGCFKVAKGQDNLKEWIPDNANLKPVRLEEYGGFLFVNLDLEAQYLHAQAPQFLQDMHNYSPRLDKFICVERYQREVQANWKTILDNNHECYHCAVNHKTLMELVDYQKKAILAASTA